ncbi:hypothetical protein ELG63_36625 [Rhizobium leguminosarum]|uniref:PIN domain-containing protein n=1 Tax=Rhizobium leguminosarum TaxID=384 RepID=UPI00102F3A00|nr:PIN domain-containing protein [Rhizobium leguminosarum]TBH28214.1 hypothetical protein ELG63_36625 [Rhizobium leguminosarum]
MTYYLMIDTSVWLDIVKDQRLDPVLVAIEELTRVGTVALIIPEQVVFEFDRNKERVKDSRKASLVAAVKRFREILGQIASADERDKAYEMVNRLQHKLSLTVDTSENVVTRIFTLMAVEPVIPTSDAVKLRAADRSLAKTAPCHMTKNSIADAIILEAFLEAVAADGDADGKHYFITSNTSDFSDLVGDKRLPHPHLSPHFAAPTSFYSTQIAEVIRGIDADLLDEFTLDDEFVEQPRQLSEIIDAQMLLFRQVWYGRHRHLRHRVGTGEVKLVDEIDYSRRPVPQDLMTQATWERASAAAKRTEDEVGIENLGPWSDFEWGMINGKLSAIRWVMGSEWDFLDT